MMRYLVFAFILCCSQATAIGQTYETLLADPDLIAYWNGDANDDATGDANDVQGTYNLTWQGTPAYSSAPAGKGDGQAFDLDGSTNSLTSSSLAAISAAVESNGSFVAWLNIDASQPANNRNVFGPDVNRLWRNMHVVSGVVRGQFTALTGDILTGPTLTVGQWYHVVFTWEANSQQLIVDGSIVDSQTDATLLETSGAGVFGLGGYVNGSSSNRFKGDIYAPMIWQRALTESEAAALAAGPSSGPAINPISSSIPGSSLDPIRTTIP